MCPVTERMQLLPPSSSMSTWSGSVTGREISFNSLEENSFSCPTMPWERELNHSTTSWLSHTSTRLESWKDLSSSWGRMTKSFSSDTKTRIIFTIKKQTLWHSVTKSSWPTPTTTMNTSLSLLASSDKKSLCRVILRTTRLTISWTRFRRSSCPSNSPSLNTLSSMMTSTS